MADELEFGGQVAVAEPLPFGAFEVDLGGSVAVAASGPLFEPFELDLGGSIAVASRAYFEPFEVDVGGAVAVLPRSGGATGTETIFAWLGPDWLAVTEHAWAGGDGWDPPVG